MRICVPVVPATPAGGFQFLASFERYLQANGHQVTLNLDDSYQILFANSWHVERDRILGGLRRNPDARVIHRIDGIAKDYGRHDDADSRQSRANRMADATIFQSAYSRYAAREKFNVIGHDGPVIHNPVDVNLFTPDGEKRELPAGEKIACVSWSTNPMKGAPSVYAVAQAAPDIQFILCGRYADVPNLPNIHQQGVLDRKPLAATLRACDVLLTFSRNEACPNHVLEGLASGLPVLYADSGATPELVGDSGMTVTESDFSEKFRSVLARREALSRRARERACEAFHPRIIFSRYVEILEATLAAPPTHGRGNRLTQAYADLLYSPFRAAGRFIRYQARRFE